jgi:DNA repair protein RAD5
MMNDADSSLDMVIKSITSKDGEPINDEAPTEGMDMEEEEKKEVTDDQLNTIYEKAQVFDAQIKPMDTPDTITLELKEYQKRALAWLTAKEANSYEDDDVDMRAMHPLWEEYSFPGEFADEYRFFYFNPYSGELSLEFPEANKQETGGILADGKNDYIMPLIFNCSMCCRNGAWEND